MIRRIPNRVAPRVDLLRVTLFVIVLLTGIPAYLRPLGQRTIYWGYQPLDVIANVLLYLPLGLFQITSSLLSVAARAALLSTTIEGIQLVSAYRYPGPMDVLSNTAGAVLGHFLARRLRLHLRFVPAKRLQGTLILMLATGSSVIAQHWAALHAMGREIAPTAQSIGLGYAFGLIALVLLQRTELELRLFTSAVLGFIAGRLLLAGGVYLELGYALPLLGCVGGLFAAWTTRPIERLQTTE